MRQKILSLISNILYLSYILKVNFQKRKEKFIMSTTVQLILQIAALVFAAAGGYFLRGLQEPEKATGEGGEE